MRFTYNTKITSWVRAEDMIPGIRYFFTQFKHGEDDIRKTDGSYQWVSTYYSGGELTLLWLYKEKEYRFRLSEDCFKRAFLVHKVEVQ